MPAYLTGRFSLEPSAQKEKVVGELEAKTNYYGAIQASSGFR